MLQLVGLAGLFTLLLLALTPPPMEPIATYTRSPLEAPEIAVSTSTPLASTTTPVSTPPTSTPIKKTVVKPQVTPVSSPTAAIEESKSTEIRRIETPYTSPPFSAAEIDVKTRSALVNIFCETEGGPLSAASGSGVIISSKGVILTNAHVAQYVLLGSNPRVNLECSIRSGSPAQAKWKADILFFPPAWVRNHAKDIRQSRPKGTGENDYALLVISGTLDQNPLPIEFPFIAPDTREAIAFISDSVLLAGYPAEFGGGSATRSALYPVSVFSRIDDLLTFGETSVDLLSLGSVALAQSGSSGGAVVNLWGRLVGLITTTSEGATTAERDLRAITTAYIDRDVQNETGSSLLQLMSGDVQQKARTFTESEARSLSDQIIENI